MLSLSRGENLPRRARAYSVKKRAASSRVSLLSNLTALSKSSAESTSTITQESYLRSERRRKRRSSRSTRQREARIPSSIMQAEKKQRKAGQHSASDVDVFSYLIKDIADPSGPSISWEAERNRVSKRASGQEDPDDIESKSIKSRLSDSGMSLNDSGYESTSQSSCLKPRLGSLPENVLVENYGQSNRQPRCVRHQDISQIPPSLLQGHLQSRYHCPEQYWPPAIPYPPHQLREEHFLQDTSPSRPPISGYDLLATRLTPLGTRTSKLPLLYRRFTTLNHRILLQLQDEISEMEADLRRLDDVEAYHRRDQPASRRSDWGSGRLDLLGKIHMKIEQYHAAIVSMQNVKASTSNAKTDDIEIYRQWLSENRPLQELEMRYLDDEDDIMSLNPVHPSEPKSGLSQPQYEFYLLSSLAGVWLIAFVPSLFSRWTFLIFTAVFTVGTQPPKMASFDITEAWMRLKSIALPLAFWMLVVTTC